MNGCLNPVMSALGFEEIVDPFGCIFRRFCKFTSGATAADLRTHGEMVIGVMTLATSLSLSSTKSITVVNV